MGSKRGDATAAAIMYAEALEWGRAGRLTDALARLCAAVAADASTPRLEDGIPWLHTPGVLEAMTLEWAASQLLRPLVQMINGLPEHLTEGDPRHDNVQAAEHIARVLSRKFPHRGAAYFTLAAIARCLGHHDEAVAMAERGYQVEPSAPTCLQLAHAYRDAGRRGEAMRTYEHALRLDPQIRTARRWLALVGLDVAVEERDQSAWQRALALVEAEAASPGADPHTKMLAAIARWHAHGDATSLMAALAQRKQGDAESLELWHRCFPPTPWLTVLEPPPLPGPEWGDAAPAVAAPVDPRVRETLAAIANEPFQLDAWQWMADTMATALAPEHRLAWRDVIVAAIGSSHGLAHGDERAQLAHDLAGCLLVGAIEAQVDLRPPAARWLVRQGWDGRVAAAEPALVALVARARRHMEAREDLAVALEGLVARLALEAAAGPVRPLPATRRAIGLVFGDRPSSPSADLRALVDRLRAGRVTP